MNKRILSRQRKRLNPTGADARHRSVSRGKVSTAPPAVDEMLKSGGLTLQPKTPEERSRRMVTTLTPTRPCRPSVNQALRRLVDEPSGPVMGRLGIEFPLVRGPILRSAHSAVERKEKTILDAALDQTNLSSTARKVIRAVAAQIMEMRP